MEGKQRNAIARTNQKLMSTQVSAMLIRSRMMLTLLYLGRSTAERAPNQKRFRDQTRTVEEARLRLGMHLVGFRLRALVLDEAQNHRRARHVCCRKVSC